MGYINQGNYLDWSVVLLYDKEIWALKIIIKGF